MKSALFTGSEFFSTCEKPVKNHVKILVSHVFSEVNSHVSHRKFTGFYPIVKGSERKLPLGAPDICGQIHLSSCLPKCTSFY